LVNFDSFDSASNGSSQSIFMMFPIPGLVPPALSISLIKIHGKKPLLPLLLHGGEAREEGGGGGRMQMTRIRR
jgi:hypothetical protein